MKKTCNRCGRCCREEVCLLGESLIVDNVTPPCKALVKESPKEATLLQIRATLSAVTGIDLNDTDAEEQAWDMRIALDNELSSLALREFPQASNTGEALELLQANNPNKYRASLRQIKAAWCLYLALATGMAWANYPGDEFPSPKSVSKEYYLSLDSSWSFYNKMLTTWAEYQLLTGALNA
jgi:hypothetical protein